MTGNEKDFVSLRVAYKLDLKGPAISVHTACSTSLVAVIMLRKDRSPARAATAAGEALVALVRF